MRYLPYLRHLTVTWCILSCTAVLPASAKDPTGKWANSPNAQWYGEQHDGNGQWCCDQSDAHPYEGGYTLNKDGSVTLDNGVMVAAYKVITKPNPNGGQPVWWYTQPTTNGTYCFALGTLM